MVDVRVVIGDPESKKCYQKKISDIEANSLVGMHVGEIFKGELVGLAGYELKITGGSDKDGFPMRSDMKGLSGKHPILACGGVGHRQSSCGERRRKLVHSHTIDATIAQVNVRVEKTGKKPMAELFPVGAEKKPEA